MPLRQTEICSDLLFTYCHSASVGIENQSAVTRLQLHARERTGSLTMQFQYLVLLTATVGISITHAQESFVESGAYGIRYCGTGASSKAATLQSLLSKFQSLLRLVQVDAQNATESKAFRAFFKNQSSAAYVRAVFKRMTDGRPAVIPGEGLGDFEKPSLVCLSPSMPGYGALKKQCGSTSIATTRRNRAFVILCDPFWHLDEEPNRLECPVVSRNVFVHNQDDQILHNQFAAFVHEMAHAYTTSWTPADRATQGIMDCVKLSAGESIRNMQNYALYAASE